MQVGLCFEQKNQSNIYCEQADSLPNTLAYIMIFILIHVYIYFGGSGWSRKKKFFIGEEWLSLLTYQKQVYQDTFVLRSYYR